MFENLALSFQGIWNHKTRSFLTMLGIIIGIAAIITIVSTIKGTNDQIKENLIGSGTNLVNVTIARTDGGYFEPGYSQVPSDVSLVDEATMDEVRALSGVKDATAYLQRSWANDLFLKNTSVNASVYGIDGHYFSTVGYELICGRYFTEADYKSARKVLIIDTTLMENAFEGTNPLGKILEFGGEPFTVIGVVDKTQEKSVVINTPSDYYMYANQGSGCIFLTDSVWPIMYTFDEPKYVSVRAETTDDMTTVGNDTATLLTERLITGSTYKYQADNLLEQASELQAVSNSTSQQLIWIAGISLLVGGIGVMNIMLVSVTERTQEIGLKKAIGAKRRSILGQFLTEAGVLTSLGGVLGVASGIGLSRMLSSAMDMPVAVSIPACIIAVAFSMFIGILFGLIPAIKASKLNPIEALRRD